MAELIIHSGKLQGKRLSLPDREIIVGRDEDCHMRLTSTLVSRRHCALDVKPDGIWVRDLGSQNGTYVNDVAITEPMRLRGGDVLRIGAALFLVPESNPAAAKPKAVNDSSKISDAEIADWLTDEEPTSSLRSSDSTVIQQRPVAKAEPPAPSTSSTPAGPNAGRQATASRTAFRSVKEEAAEIIKKHWESIRPKQGE